MPLEILAEQRQHSLPGVGRGWAVVDTGTRIVEEGVLGAGVHAHLKLLAASLQRRAQLLAHLRCYPVVVLGVNRMFTRFPQAISCFEYSVAASTPP